MADTTGRWEVVKTIFGQAIELEGQRREQYLREACAGDADLLREVNSLLAADSPDTVFQSPLKTPAVSKRPGNRLVLAGLGIVVVALMGWVVLRQGAEIQWSLVTPSGWAVVKMSEPVYLKVRARRAGYLYLLSDDQARDSLNALGTFPVAAGVEAKIPGADGFQFDEPGGVDLWCVWSSEKLAELERLGSLFNATDKGVVRDYEERVRLRQFLDTPPKSVRTWSIRVAAR